MKYKDSQAWTALVEAELATAAVPLSGDTIDRTARTYAEAGLPKVALGVLRKAPCFGVESISFLPATLRLAREQRQFSELSGAVVSAQAVKVRGRHLRRELAMGLASLRQESAAQDEWAAFIRTGEMKEEDWLACSRFMMNATDAGLTLRLMLAVAECAQDEGSPLLKYCVAKYFVEADMAKAPSALEQIEAARIPDGDLLVDLAILCWRSRDYARAETAAKRASEGLDAPPASTILLSSIRSFSGDFSMLREISLPMAAPLAGRLLNTAQSIRRDASLWGVFHSNPARCIQLTTVDLGRDPAMVIPQALTPIATFSILSDPSDPDPFRILSGVDWSLPHIMLQRRPEGDLLHVFVESHEHPHWCWEEVKAGEHDLHRDPGYGQRSTTWAKVVEELKIEETD